MSISRPGTVIILRQNLTEIRNGNAFLVGDALGLATLDMGEGIGPAIRSGQLAAEAIISRNGILAGIDPALLFPIAAGIEEMKTKLYPGLRVQAI